jgi:hypothetical protein
MLPHKKKWCLLAFHVLLGTVGIENKIESSKGKKIGGHIMPD